MKEDILDRGNKIGTDTDRTSLLWELKVVWHGWGIQSS